MPIKKIKSFFELEEAAGIFLGIIAILAIIIANSPFSDAFNHFLHSEYTIQFGAWEQTLSLSHWIKDGLMAIFFFHVGLEIKKEILVGELSSPKKLALPVFAALGGMIGPALIYLLIVSFANDANLIKGWPIPVATDIAFAVAAISLVAKKVPLSLKIFLLTLAVVDDLGAVILIAALYSGDINTQYLVWALSIFLFLLFLPKIGITRPWIFVSLGIVMWAMMLKTGFHSTLAGVLTALAVPLHAAKAGDESPLEDLHDDFSAWVKYAILPLFALSHAGFSFEGIGFATIFAPLTLAIILGLFIGKPIGVLSLIYLSTKLNIASLPNSTNYKQLLGVSLLCGIGFTMSLFLGGLAFIGASEIIHSQIKIAVFIGSILSGILGILILNNQQEMKKE